MLKVNPITKNSFSPRLNLLVLIFSLVLTASLFLPYPTSPAEIFKAEAVETEFTPATNDLASQIFQIDTELITLEEKKSFLQREIKNTEKRIADLNLLLTGLETNLQGQKLKFTAFLRWHYIFAGELLYLSVIDVSSWSDFIFSLNYLLVLIEKQSDSWHRLKITIATHKQKQEEMLSLLVALQQKQAEYDRLKAEYLARKAELDRLSKALHQQSPLTSTYYAELIAIRRQIISDLKTCITALFNRPGNISSMWLANIFSPDTSQFQITPDMLNINIPLNFTSLQIKPETGNKYTINGTYLSDKRAYSFNISAHLKFNEDNTLSSMVESFIINDHETIKNGEFLIFSL